MSGNYKFDSQNEKIDEMELVTDYDEKVEQQRARAPSNVLVVVLLLIVLFLLVVLIALVAYGTFKNDSSCSCDGASSDTFTGSGTTSQGCNSTQITEIHQTTQSTYQQQLLQANYVSSVAELLQEIRSAQMVFYESSTDLMNMTLEYSENSIQTLTNLIATLANHKDTSISTAAVIDDIMILVTQLLQLQNASVLFNSVKPVSCKDIKALLPNSPSGYYHVNSRNVYCNMEELCGSGDGWTRVAYLDMADSTVSCPSGFYEYQSGDVRACGRTSSTVASCTPSVTFPSEGISYSEVCGRVVGYQKGSVDAVNTYFVPISEHNDINSYYVDGVSITRGSPRQHVWTFMAGLQDSVYAQFNCPCNTPPGGSQQIQSFIGSNYFCESGNPNTGWSQIVYTDDPLWDGEGCGSQEGNCCAAEGLPWFHRVYDTTTTDYLELRVCGDQSTGDEDSPVSFYEIYIK